MKSVPMGNGMMDGAKMQHVEHNDGNSGMKYDEVQLTHKENDGRYKSSNPNCTEFRGEIGGVDPIQSKYARDTKKVSEVDYFKKK